MEDRGYKYIVSKPGDGYVTRDVCRLDGSTMAAFHQRENARLIAAAPELLEAQVMGQGINTPDFLDWLADRLVHVYGERPQIGFVLSLRERAASGRAAIAKATGGDA